MQLEQIIEIYKFFSTSNLRYFSSNYRHDKGQDLRTVLQFTRLRRLVVENIVSWQ